MLKLIPQKILEKLFSSVSIENHLKDQIVNEKLVCPIDYSIILITGSMIGAKLRENKIDKINGKFSFKKTCIIFPIKNLNPLRLSMILTLIINSI